MNRILTLILVTLNLVACTEQTAKNTAKMEPKLVSQLVTNRQGKTYLEVDGRPVLYNAVQAWLPEDGNYEIYMQKAKEAGYDMFSIWFPWRGIEPEMGLFDWSILDKLIEQAENYDMMLDIVWGGSSFCGGLDVRFAPDFILKNKDFLLKDEKGRPVEIKKFDMGMCNIADYNNPELLKIEANTVRNMMDYLYERDTTHRVVFFQVENEPNLFDWTKQDKQLVLNYCDSIGKIVKESAYSIATRMNLSGKSYEPLIDSMDYIDCHGIDIYTDDLQVLKESVTYNTKMPHVAENAAYENSSTLIAEALANGGFYNIYRLDYDYVWDNPGVYGDDWIYLPQTFDIMLLNRGLRKIGAQIAESTADNMFCFNTETKNPVKGFKDTHTHKGVDIGFHSIKERHKSTEAIGFVLYYKENYYLIADNQCTFIFAEEFTAENGEFDSDGKWITTDKKDVTLNGNGKFEVVYNYYDCIKISL